MNDVSRLEVWVDRAPCILESIYLEAALRFKKCGEESDFDIQTVSISAMTFGGTNRVIWNAKEGFHLDRGYCRPKFLAIWDIIYGEGSPIENSETFFSVLKTFYKNKWNEAVPTTEAIYYDQFCSVPPTLTFPGGFLSGEPYTHNILGEAVYAAFMREGNKVLAKYMTIKETEEYCA